MLRHLMGMAITLLFILPFYWGFIASLRAVGVPPTPTIDWWPANPAWGNYAEIFTIVPLSRYTLNSVLVVAVALPLTLISASLAGFSMAQLPRTLRQPLLIFSIATLMIPGSAVWLFRFQIFRWLGLLDTLWALIAPAFAASNPLFVLLFYWAFRRIPTEIYEAARLDGADAWRCWWRVGLPLTRPTVMGVVVLTVVMYWSDFIGPVIYIFNTTLYTLPVGLQLLKQMDQTNIPLLMAAAVVMTVPIILLFTLLQRFFLQDLSFTNLVDGS